MITKHNTDYSKPKSITSTESVLLLASRHAVNSASEDQSVAHILMSSDKEWLSLLCLQEKHPLVLHMQFQDVFCHFMCMCSTVFFVEGYSAFENSWVGKECLKLEQVSPEVMNLVRLFESVLSSKYLLINWKKFSFYCMTQLVVRPQKEAASRPTFPETGDLFWLKRHRMWWKNYSHRIH